MSTERNDGVRLGHFHWPGEEAGGVPDDVATQLRKWESEQVALYTHWRACWRQHPDPGAEFAFDPDRFEAKLHTPAHPNHRGVPAGFAGPVCIDFEAPYWFPFGRCDHPQQGEIYADDRWRRQAVALFTAVAGLLRRQRPKAPVFVWNLTPMKPCSQAFVREVLDRMDGVMLSTYLRSEWTLEQNHAVLGQRLDALKAYRAGRDGRFQIWGGVWGNYRDGDREPVPIAVQREHARWLIKQGVDGIVVFGRLLTPEDLAQHVAANWVEIQDAR